MTRKRRLRCEQARRALFDLQELVVDILEENPQGLEPNQIATELNIIIPQGRQLYSANRAEIAWGILDGLVSEGRVEKRGSRAFLSSNPPADQSTI